MSNPTAPYIPVAQVHWSFSDEIAQAKRTLERREQAVVARARREVQSILGACLYHKLTGVKPDLRPVRPAVKRVLTTADLL